NLILSCRLGRGLPSFYTPPTHAARPSQHPRCGLGNAQIIPCRSCPPGRGVCAPRDHHPHAPERPTPHTNRPGTAHRPARELHHPSRTWHTECHLVQLIAPCCGVRCPPLPPAPPI